MAHASQRVNGGIISSLLHHPFYKQSLEEQYQIVHSGRPTPYIDTFLQPGKKGKNDPNNTQYVLDYNMAIYKYYEWLAGNNDTEKLHCWPCLLMCGYKGNERCMWVAGVHSDLKTLVIAAEKHCVDEEHVKNLCMVAKLHEDVNQKLLANFRRNFPQFNRKAILNRALLNKLIDVAILAFKLDLSVEYLGTDWSTAEKFQGLFNLVIAERKDLIKHCQDMGNEFTIMIRTFFHDFLDCLQEQIQHLGYLEIVRCSPQPLCAIQLDSIRDVDAGKNLLFSIINTYVNKEGVLQQHFFGLESNTTRSAANVGRYVNVAMLRYTHTTVSQSYDGACVFVDELTSLRKAIQISAPSAVLVPSIDHPLNQVLMQGIFNVKGVQLFVATVQDLIQNPKQLQALYRLQNPSSACVSQTRWSIDSKFLSFLLNERESFVSVFNRPPTNVSLALDMCVMIKRLVNNLEDVNFLFLLFAFVDILKITDDLADVVRVQLSDSSKCTNAVKSAITKLKLLKGGDNARNYIEEATKCIPVGNGNVNPASLVKLFDLIIENIVLQIESRFGDIQQFEFLQLTDSEKFLTYDEAFPERALITLGKLYGKHFDIKQLEKELKSSIYRDPRFRSLSAVDIIKLIHEMGLKDSIPQAYKLFCLVVTLPITEVEGRNCLKLIHSFMDDAKRHSFERYENHKSLPIVGLNTVLIKHSQVVIEKPLVLHLVTKKDFQDHFVQQYLKAKREEGIRFDCAL